MTLCDKLKELLAEDNASEYDRMKPAATTFTPVEGSDRLEVEFTNEPLETQDASKNSSGHGESDGGTGESPAVSAHRGDAFDQFLDPFSGFPVADVQRGRGTGDFARPDDGSSAGGHAGRDEAEEKASD